MRTAAITRVIALALVAGAARAGEPPLFELMPRPGDHTAMWWRDGFPSVVEGAEWRRVVRTGHYWFLLDTDTLSVARLGPSSRPPGDLPGAELTLKLIADGKTYLCDGGAEWTKFGGPRLIESGRFLQRADVTGLTFTAEDGARLGAEARLEAIAWPDRLGFRFAARPGLLPIAAGEDSWGRVGGGFGIDEGHPFLIPAEELAAAPGTFALSFWVFAPKDYQAGKHAPWLVCKNGHEQADGNFGLVLQSGGVPDLRLNIGGGRENVVAARAERRHALRLDRWNHLVLGYDGRVLRLFVNAQLAVEKEIGRTFVPRPGTLTFGRRGDGLAGFEFRGVIDQVRLYGKPLEHGQVRHSYHHPGPGLPHLEPLGEWTFRGDGKMSEALPRDSWKAASLEVSLAGEGGELRARSDAGEGSEWREVSLMMDPVAFAEVPDESEVGVEAVEVASGEARPVSFEPALGWHRINLDGIEPIPPAGQENPSNDAIERVRLSLSNPGDFGKVARLLFEKTPRGILQKIGTPITGVSAILRDREGSPTGIPVQLSKNWHSHPEGGVYDGQWFHGITQVRLPAGAEVELELVLAYGHWGGLPAASHSQLSLIGWGGNQLWDQSALGAWGESICYAPEQIQAACTITDVRPLMVTSMSERTPEFNWTNNVGGGDFFRVFDAEGNRIPHGPMRTTYHRQGPCLTEVTYAGRVGEGMSHRVTASLGRSDDLVRGTYRVRLDVAKPVDFSRLAIFQVGADTYNYTRERRLAVGDAAGLRREWEAQWGGDVYRGEPIECAEADAWASLHEAERREGHESGAWANRGLVIREWKARLGGEEANPWLAERGIDLSSEKTSIVDLVPPPGVTRLEPGDFVEATIEHIVVPQFGEDYHGPNEALRAALRKHGNTWRMIEREAVGNRREVEVIAGRLLRRYPDIRIETTGGGAEYRLEGGIGFVPVTFTGLDSHDGRELWIDGERLDQGVHGRDFWQADYDPASMTWSLTFNLPAAAGDKPRTVRLSPTPAP